MAKIERLFPHWRIPTPNEVGIDKLKIAVEHAVSISEEVPELLDILPLEQLRQAIEMPRELKELLRLMMDVDPSTRPSASFALASRCFTNFEELSASSLLGLNYELLRAASML